MSMEGNVILNTASGLHAVNELLKKYVSGQTLSFEEKRELWLFYRDHKDTNAIIDYVLGEGGSNPDLLLHDTKQLLAEAEAFIEVYKASGSLISSFETKSDCDRYLKPFKDAWESEKEKAHDLWMEYQEISHRIDFMPYSDPEFKPLDEKCDRLKEEYDKVHAHVNELYEIHRKEILALSGLYYFDIAFLNVLVHRLSEIAKCIIADICNPEEGGEA